MVHKSYPNGPILIGTLHGNNPITEHICWALPKASKKDGFSGNQQGKISYVNMKRIKKVKNIKTAWFWVA